MTKREEIKTLQIRLSFYSGDHPETADRLNELMSHKSKAGNGDHLWVFAGGTCTARNGKVTHDERCTGCNRRRRVYSADGKIYRR